ncbi:MAG: hypothetical protein R3A47_00710 [Polyangiales bacterium]
MDKASSADAASKTGANDPVQNIVSQLQAGKIDAAQALELLVDKAMQSPQAQKLNEKGRAELQAHLQDMLINDPTLSGLADRLKS